MAFPRSYRAGDTVEDLCRACKIDRDHTVIVAEPSGRPLRVQCDYCGSQHQFRGGARRDVPAGADPGRTDPSRGAPARPAPAPASSAAARVQPWPLVSERERTEAPLMVTLGQDQTLDIETLLRRIIREETGLTPVAPAEKWRGGTLVLKPGNTSLQDKSWPIETLFHKIVMIRNRLRTLEQQINALDIPEDVKVKVQSYLTGCYGSLTSFNVLFADEADHFKGSGDS